MTQAPSESRLLDVSIFGWSGSYWKFVLDPVSGGKNCKLNWRILQWKKLEKFVAISMGSTALLPQSFPVKKR